MILRRALILCRDTSGVVAPIVAILAAVLIASTALALDFGAYYVGNRNLQSATDAAALSAAIDPGNAASRASAFLQSNGYPASVIQSVAIGRYCADSTMTASARFIPAGTTGPCPGNGLSNAIRLKTSQASPQYFSRIFGNASPIPLMAATATAARIDEAGIAMTTGVLGVDIGLVNTILSTLSGQNVALSSNQYLGLLGSNIDAARFFDALAIRVGETGTYAALTNRTVSMADILSASQTALNGSNPNTISALQTLSSQLGGSIQVPLSGLFGLGVWAKMPVGGAPDQPDLRAGLNAYQLISYALQSGNHGLSIIFPASQVGVAGITQLRLVGTASGPVAHARFSFGPAGETTVSTSAIRLQFVVSIANLGGLLNGLGLSVVNQLLVAPLQPLLNSLVADIPLLIDIGAGSGAISSISCAQEAASDTQVNVAANSGLLSAYIGTLPFNPLSAPLPAITPANVTTTNLISLLGLLTVDMKAVAGPVTGASRTLNFRQVAGGDGIIGHPPFTAQPARVGNGSQAGPLLTTLGSNLVVNACLLGSCATAGPLVNNVLSAVVPLLKALGVDPLLDTIFNALGVQPGYADVFVTGARCGVPVLV